MRRTLSSDCCAPEITYFRTLVDCSSIADLASLTELTRSEERLFRSCAWTRSWMAKNIVTLIANTALSTTAKAITSFRDMATFFSDMESRPLFLVGADPQRRLADANP